MAHTQGQGGGENFDTFEIQLQCHLLSRGRARHPGSQSRSHRSSKGAAQRGDRTRCKCQLGSVTSPLLGTCEALDRYTGLLFSRSAHLIRFRRLNDRPPGTVSTSGGKAYICGSAETLLESLTSMAILVHFRRLTLAPSGCRCHGAKGLGQSLLGSLR